MGSRTTFVTKTTSAFRQFLVSELHSAKYPLLRSARSIANGTRCQSSSFYTRSHESPSSEWSSHSSSSSIKPVFPTLTGYFNTASAPLSLQHYQVPREIIFLGGAPGAGKGTNSVYIAKLRSFDAPTIVVSDLLNTPACRILKENGIMVDDNFVFRILLQELARPMYRQGVVVDGFPRTGKQVEQLIGLSKELSDMCSLTRMSFVMLHVDEEVSIHRQQARGRKALQLMSERAGSAELSQVRATDLDIDASRARYLLFQEHLQTLTKLNEHSIPLVVVDASSSIEVVRAKIASQIATLPL